MGIGVPFSYSLWLKNLKSKKKKCTSGVWREETVWGGRESKLCFKGLLCVVKKTVPHKLTDKNSNFIDRTNS